MGNLKQGKMSKGGVNEKPKSPRPESPPAQESTNMTSKEAIKVLQSNYPDSRYTMLREAVDMAIKALESESEKEEWLNK